MSNEEQQKRMEEIKRQSEAVENRLKDIGRLILVLSGKGGVGKSTVAANMAMALSEAGKNVGLLDIDIHGPSIPGILGLEGRKMDSDGNMITPIEYTPNLKVISIGFLLANSDNAVIWRGPLKHQVIRQFLSDVNWGKLDYLVVDSPPGTGDEPLSIAQILQTRIEEMTKSEKPSGAVIVTTPQNVAVNDVRKCVTFCRQIKMPVLGVVENMSGFVCPECGEHVDIFKTGGGKKMANEMDIPFLGSIPLDPKIVETSDAGKPYLTQYKQSEASRDFENIVKQL